MIELPIERSDRIRSMSGCIHAEDDSIFEFVGSIVMSNKIMYLTPSPSFIRGSRHYTTGTFKVDSFDQLSEMLDSKFNEGQILCLYSISQSPLMYNPNNNFQSHRSIMIRGAFIDKPDNFELRDIIDRDQQIEKILN